MKNQEKLSTFIAHLKTYLMNNAFHKLDEILNKSKVLFSRSIDTIDDYASRVDLQLTKYRSIKIQNAVVMNNF